MESTACPYFLNMIQGEGGDDREGPGMGKENWISKGPADPRYTRKAGTDSLSCCRYPERETASRTLRFSMKFDYFRSSEHVGAFAGPFWATDYPPARRAGRAGLQKEEEIEQSF